MSAQLSVLPSASRHSPGIRLPPEASSILVELANDFASVGSALYAIGQSTADFLPLLHARLSRGVDVMTADPHRGITVRDASVVILTGISQQVHPLQRPQLLADVYRGLRVGGCALLIDITRMHDSLLNNLFATHTQESWRSDPHETSRTFQIASTVREECAFLSRAGFRSIEVFYKYYGLCGLVAIK